MKKRLFALLLTLCMVFSMLPVTALASQPDTETIPSLSLRMDTVTLGQAEDDDNDYSKSTTEQVGLMRKAMVARTSEYKICYTTSEYDDDTLLADANDFLADAVKYTDEPTQGDYLLYSLGDASVSIDGYVEDDLAYVTMIYEFTYSTTAAQEQEVTEAVQAILDELDVYCTHDQAKVEAIYDYVCSNVSYAGPITDDTLLYQGSAHAALTDSAVSYGIAQLFYRLALELELKARMVYGEVNGEEHCWNLIKIGNLYYNVDASLDAGKDSYQYFLKSNDGMADHVRAEEFTTDKFKRYHTMDSRDMADDEYVTESGSLGENVTWTLGHRGTVTVTGTGEMFNYAEFRESPLYDFFQQITNIIIGDGITTVGDYVFTTSKAQRLTIGKDVTSIGDYAFGSVDKLYHVDIPDKVTSLGDHAFDSCYLIQPLELPEKLETIGDYAFSETVIQSVTIPASVSHIGEGAFYACNSLPQILVDSENQHYVSIDGLLYDADVTTLVGVPAGKTGSITIPDTITVIPRGFFYRCEFTEITIGKSVSEIHKRAFSSCYPLETIYFTGSAPTFEDNTAFEHVTATAYYHSNDETWTSAVMKNYGGTITWTAYCPDGHVTVIRDAAEATCTEDGYTGDEVCENCGELISKGSVIPAIGHSYDSVTADPTCTQDGSVTRTCSVCGDVSVEVLPATGHSVSDWAVTTAPTCTEKGEETGTCATCGETVTREIDATGHSFGDWVVTTEPTCTDKGTETRTCAVCEATETRDVDALGHTMGEDCVDNEDGKTHTGTCTVCGALVEDDPHSFVDGFCEDCGAIALVAPELLSVFSREQTSCKATWTPVDHAEGYELWRTTAPEDKESWRRIKTIKDGAQDRYTNQGLEVGITYYYKVRAYIGEEEATRVYSEFSEVKYMPAAVVFDNPYSNSTFRIRLRWEEIGGADGYQIWRLNDDGTWGIIKTLGDKGNSLTNDQGATTAYSNTGLEAGKQYTYKMRAFAIPEDGVKVFGAYSDEFTVAVMPEAPEVTATSPKTGRAELSWEAVNGAAGYQVWMAESENGEYKIIKSVTDGSTAYTKYDLTSGKTYYFKVRAYVEVNGKKTFGDYSQVAAVTVK